MPLLGGSPKHIQALGSISGRSQIRRSFEAKVANCTFSMPIGHSASLIQIHASGRLLQRFCQLNKLLLHPHRHSFWTGSAEIRPISEKEIHTKFLYLLLVSLYSISYPVKRKSM